MTSVQTRFAVDVEKPWKGVCCENCWNAREKKCVCRCGGRYHGLGLQARSVEPGLQTLPGDAASKILALIKDKRCRWCGAAMGPPVYCYEHPGGWEVPGFEKKLWLYLKCPKCGYDWALWKLGVQRS